MKNHNKKSCGKCSNNILKCTCKKPEPCCEEKNCCCEIIVPSDCIEYKGEDNCLATSGANLTTIINNITNQILPITKSVYNTTCIGGGTSTSLTDSVNLLIAKQCEGQVPLFNTTCLSNLGSANSSTEEAIALLITKVCEANNEFPSFDTTCLGGSDNSSLSLTIETILSSVCETAVTPDVLNWGSCYTTPAFDTLSAAIQNIIDYTQTLKNTFSLDYFITDQSDPCNTVVSIDKDKLATIIYNEFISEDYFTDIINNYVTNNLTFKIDDEDTCPSQFLKDKFSVGEGLSINKKCRVLHIYTYNTLINKNEWEFISYTSSTGITYTIPTSINTDVNLIESWLIANTEISNVTIAISSIGLLSIVVETYGNTTDETPVFTIKPSSILSEITLNNINATASTNTDECCTLHIELEDQKQEEETPAPDECELDIIGRDGICVNKETAVYSTWVSSTTVIPIQTFTANYISINGVDYFFPANTNVVNQTAMQAFLDTIEEFNITYTITPQTGFSQVFISVEGYVLESLPVELYINELPLPLSFDLQSQDITNTCKKFIVGECGTIWLNPQFKNGWNGDIAYRVKKDRIEIRGGSLFKNSSVPEYKYYDDAFSIPEFTASRRMTWSTYGKWNGSEYWEISNFGPEKSIAGNQIDIDLSRDLQAGIDFTPSNNCFKVFAQLYCTAVRNDGVFSNTGGIGQNRPGNHPSNSVLSANLQSAPIEVYIPDITIFL